MKYKIFKDYDEFCKRSDSDMNGFPQTFVDGIGIDTFNEMVNNEKYNNNIGCWECLNCANCYNCINCINCADCINCFYCYSCFKCKECNDCNSCYECYHCDELEEQIYKHNSKYNNQ